MRVLFLLATLSVVGWASPGVAQVSQSAAACAYGAPRDCFDGRDRTDRVNRDDLANRTRIVASSAADITDRANRDDLANRTRIVASSVADITDRANRDNTFDRTDRANRDNTFDRTNRANRDDTTDRTLACP